MKFCVIIPTYQGAKTLPVLLTRLFQYIAREDVIVVDDGSTDGTFEIATNFGVDVIKSSDNGKNMGKGFALKRGFARAIQKNYDAVITIDADLQHPPELIPQFIEKIHRGADMVVGNRMNDISTMPIERRLSNYLSSLAVSILAGQRFPDSQCGFRAIRRWVLENVQLFFNRYQMESEMLIEAKKIGAKIEFVPIPTIYNSTGKSFFHPILDTARFIAFVIAYYPTRILAKPIRIQGQSPPGNGQTP